MAQDAFIERLSAGDEQAWEEFLAKYGRIIHAAAARLGLQKAEQEDLLQATCLAVLQSVHTLKNPNRLASWLYSVSYRLGIDACRRRRERPLGDVPADATAAEPESTRIDEERERHERIALLLDALDAIDAKCRNLLMALYLDDSRPSYQEIAKRQKIPIGSIGPTRARCLKKVFEGLKILSNDAPSPSTRQKRNPHDLGMNVKQNP
jgi:RNA polymerase sigma factor (sigma-70 family)